MGPEGCFFLGGRYFQGQQFFDVYSSFSDSQFFYSNAGWSKKWNDLINKGTEYGSVKSAWLNITTEADQLAEIHSELQIRLGNQVQGNVQRWKSANYHKSMLSWKETKNAEEGFSKAQKPWAKRQDEGIFCIHLFLLIIQCIEVACVTVSMIFS